MSRQSEGSDSTSFSRDTGSSHHAPKLDPYAAVRHLNAARAAASHTSPFSPGPDAVGLPSQSIFLASIPTGAERRPLDLNDEKLVDPPPAKRAKVNNTIPIGEHLKTFLDMAPQAQQALLAREAGPSHPVSCPKPHSHKLPQDGPIYRCFDCYHAPIVCKECLVRDHLRNPFHRIERWTDAAGFWERMYLGQFDNFALNLGHDGQECTSQGNVRSTTIVHEHGIVEMNVQYCVCVPKGQRFSVPEPIQLLRFGLFPGTWKKPQTAFTINGLRDYHLLSVQCQITGIDFAITVRPEGGDRAEFDG